MSARSSVSWLVFKKLSPIKFSLSVFQKRVRGGSTGGNPLGSDGSPPPGFGPGPQARQINGPKQAVIEAGESGGHLDMKLNCF